MAPWRRVLALVGPLPLLLAACTTGPEVGVDGAHIFRIVAHPQEWATTTITLTDASGLVAGVMTADPTALGLSPSDWQNLNTKGRIVVHVPGTTAIGLLWLSGVCYPEQAVSVSGTASRLEIRVSLGHPAAETCPLVGGGPTLRLAMNEPIDLSSMSLPDVK